MLAVALGVLGLVLLWLGCRAYDQPRVGDRIAYWHQTVQGLDESTERFYAQVHQALKAGLQLRDIALTGFGFGPQHLFEGTTIFSERPLYLCARYKHLTYYLYAGQTPGGFFLATWLYNRYLHGEEGRIAPTALARRYFARQTLFQHDAALMFQESVHAIVLEVLDRYIEQQQLKPLEELERRPVLHAFYRNASYSSPPFYGWPPPGAPPSGTPPQGAPVPVMPVPVPPTGASMTDRPGGEEASRAAEYLASEVDEGVDGTVPAYAEESQTDSRPGAAV